MGERGAAPRSEPTPRRAHGPAAGEPPVVVDPRRWGSVVGLVGGLVFVLSYSPDLGSLVSTLARVAGVVGAATALFAHYVRPTALGPLARPGAAALATYGLCVVGELVLIVVGTRVLVSAGAGALRPALIATAVGVHFIPFAWAFRERMFHHLGGAVTAIGVAGLLLGALGVTRAAAAAAVLAGLVMITFIVVHALGRYAPSHTRSTSAPTRR
ncbi:hypothetical protein SAMN04489747_2167 [Auraticoccus monumenti]|uniref:Uncharacterized protein n=1 Tax=Auraticoccus monumenti TaxID=675864 RepID=A0A1G6Z4J5_9ACTN|nr:hypothetical protein SAMN04489747_2167 [Auraticoccus monumenti]